MYKKFLSAILLGALTIASTSTFVSCKDYDDDINNLQTQLKSLQTFVGQKDDMASTSITSLTAALEALQTSSAKGDEATLAAAQSAIAIAKSELEAAHQKDFDNLVEKDADLSSAIIKAQEAVDQAVTLLGSKADATDLQKVADDLANAVKTMNTLSSDMTDLTSEVARLKTAVEGQQAALEAVKEDAAAAAAAAVKADLTALETSVNAAIEAETARVNEQLSGINTTLSELQSMREEVKSDVSEAKAAVLEAQEKVNGLEETVNAIDVKVNTIAIALAKSLRSLVFMPTLYMDGIETIEYPFLSDTILTLSSQQTATTANGKTIRSLYDYVIPTPLKSEVFGPAWPVDYHMNPSKSTTVYDDVKGFNVREVEVVSRASATALNVTSPEKYVNGDQLFKNANGILTVGMQIGNPTALVNNPKGTDNIVALQVRSEGKDTKDTLITSDYAMLYPEKVWVEGLVWTSKPWGSEARDEDCTISTTQKVHVWDSPKEAILAALDNGKPDVQLLYSNREGIVLSQYLGIHYVKESITKSAVKLGTWRYGSAEQLHYGLTYEFELVDYTIDGNATHDSKYVTLTSDEGRIIAQNVKEDGVTYEDESATAVGRFPLIRVKVLRGENVILDGYIAVEITRTDPDVPERSNLTIDKYPAGNHEFDLCNQGEGVLKTNWSQFSQFVLTQSLENMTKENFDAQYTLDGTNTGRTLPDGGEIWNARVFSNVNGNADVIPGTVNYFHNSEGTTNHAWTWEFTESELEALTHDQTTPVTKTSYIRYIGSAAAKYAYIYVKISTELSRKTVENVTSTEKNANYWFAADGSDDGFDAVVFNVNSPIDGGSTTTFSRDILSTYKGNAITFSGATVNRTNRKFFFIPETTQITAQNGKQYTITPRRSANDEVWNSFVCLYDQHPVNATPATESKYRKHKWGADAENKKVLEECAINYEDGVFTNKDLYAVNGTTYTLIATMNQLNGEIEITQDDVTKDILNAIGYVEGHKNIMDEFHTFIGIAAKVNCVAVNVHNGSFGKFTVSWQRPINLVETSIEEVVDAKTNGNYIYAVDFLKFYDFRGPVAGDMEGVNKWLWSYYNIKSITLDCTPSKVMTDMHSGSFKPLSQITTDAVLGCYQGGNIIRGEAKYNTFNLAAFNAHDKSDALIAYMGLGEKDGKLQVIDPSKAELFGVLYYANNGDNVTDFNVRIPVTIEYEWGKFESMVQLHINRTLGN